MKALVTGGCGFIGSHLIRRWLATRPGDQVVNLDALTYAGSTERLADVARHPGYRFVQADVCDPAAVARAMEGCGVVVHCAAETHVDRSITGPAAFIRANVEGTLVVLEQARQAGARLVHVSTDEVYGPVMSGLVDEQARLAPRSPYAASKAGADWMAQAYAATHGLPVVIARPSNAYGPWQFPEKFIPVCITRALEGQPIPLYGDGSQRRAWLHVEDLCEALLVLADRGTAGEVYNIGSVHEAANRDTAATVLKLLGRPAGLLQPVPDRPGHDWRYGIDDGKLKALGWAAHTTFDDGLARTVAWYQDHPEWWRPLADRLRADPYHWLDRADRPSAHRAPGSIR